MRLLCHKQIMYDEMNDENLRFVTQPKNRNIS